MIKHIEQSHFTSKEATHFLKCLNENAAARYYFIDINTLRLWVKLGLPYFTIGQSRENFFDPEAIMEWLESGHENFPCNRDFLWAATPPDMLPKQIELLVEYGVLAKGKYIVIAMDNDQAGGRVSRRPSKRTVKARV